MSSCHTSCLFGTYKTLVHASVSTEFTFSADYIYQVYDQKYVGI